MKEQQGTNLEVGISELCTVFKAKGLFSNKHQAFPTTCLLVGINF
jgi:hypothetical protein